MGPVPGIIGNRITVAQILQTTAQSVVFELPIPRAEGFPTMTVIPRIIAFEIIYRLPFGVGKGRKAYREQNE